MNSDILRATVFTLAVSTDVLTNQIVIKARGIMLVTTL